LKGSGGKAFKRVRVKKKTGQTAEKQTIVSAPEEKEEKKQNFGRSREKGEKDASLPGEKKPAKRTKSAGRWNKRGGKII